MPVYFPGTNGGFFEVRAGRQGDVALGEREKLAFDGACRAADKLNVQQLRALKQTARDTLMLSITEQKDQHPEMTVCSASTPPAAVTGKSLGGAAHFGRLFAGLQAHYQSDDHGAWDPYVVVTAEYTQLGDLRKVGGLQDKLISTVSWIAQARHNAEDVLFLHSSLDRVVRNDIIEKSVSELTVPAEYWLEQPVYGEIRVRSGGQETRLVVCAISVQEHLHKALEAILPNSDVSFDRFLEPGFLGENQPGAPSAKQSAPDGAESSSAPRDEPRVTTTSSSLPIETPVRTNPAVRQRHKAWFVALAIGLLAIGAMAALGSDWARLRDARVPAPVALDAGNRGVDPLPSSAPSSAASVSNPVLATSALEEARIGGRAQEQIKGEGAPRTRVSEPRKECFGYVGQDFENCANEEIEHIQHSLGETAELSELRALLTRFKVARRLADRDAGPSDQLATEKRALETRLRQVVNGLKRSKPN